MNPDSSLRIWQTWALLAGANLFWAGNWVVGRALREAYSPLTLNLGRWLLAALILAPFALPMMRGRWSLVRRHWWLLLGVAGTGCALFQSMVYAGLRATTSTNAVLLSSSGPLFILLCSWLLERQRASARQLTGMGTALAGIAIILAHGDAGRLRSLELHAGDAWIMLAMPVMGVYAVLLKRVPAALRGTALLFLMSALAVPMLAVAWIMEPAAAPSTSPWSQGAMLGLAYTAVFASVVAFGCWNRAVAAVGPNAAAMSLPLMPLFGTVLAMVFLGERIERFHIAGIAAILAGIAWATWSGRASVSPVPAGGHAPSAAPSGSPARTIRAS